MTPLGINNFTTNPIDEEWIKKVVRFVLAQEDKEGTTLSIAFVGQGRMRQLNKRYRDKNKVTDVLAFPGSSADIPSPKGFKEEGLGELVICLREVKKNAKRFKAPFKTELAKVLIHGILHLLGYDHEKSPKEAEKMFKLQEKYLTQALNSKN